MGKTDLRKQKDKHNLYNERKERLSKYVWKYAKEQIEERKLVKKLQRHTNLSPAALKIYLKDYQAAGLIDFEKKPVWLSVKIRKKLNFIKCKR